MGRLRESGAQALLSRTLLCSKATVALDQKQFKPMKDTILVAISSDGGVGQLFGCGVPSWFVNMSKGKSFLMEMMCPMMSVEKWKA